MNPIRAFELFLLRVFGFGAIFGYLLSLFQPPNLPAIVQDRPYACSIAVSLFINLLDTLVLYPKFRDPLRNAPTIPGVSPVPRIDQAACKLSPNRVAM